MSQDLAVQGRVIDELEFEPGVNAAHIGVSVHDGVVTLSGHVDSYFEKRAAEEAARRVRGVRAVAQEIVVRLPTDKRRADEDIAARALKMLRWNLCLPERAITVTVEHGVVRLGGEVDSAFQQRAAEIDVRKLGGVVDVISDIRVRPSAAAADIRGKIMAALERRADIEAAAISITVDASGVVVLNGRVRSLGEQIAAENAALSARGVVGVENHLAVAP